MSVQAMALAKALTGLITLFAAPGTPMIYAGQEFGEDSPRTIDFQPLHWGKLLQKPHADYSKTVARLIAARRQHPALRSDHIEFYSNDFATEQLVRWKRYADPGVRDYATVAVNFGATPRRTFLQVPWPGEWYDAVHDRTYQANDGCVEVELGPWDGVLLAPATM